MPVETTLGLHVECSLELLAGSSLDNSLELLVESSVEGALELLAERPLELLAESSVEGALELLVESALLPRPADPARAGVGRGGVHDAIGLPSSAAPRAAPRPRGLLSPPPMPQIPRRARRPARPGFRAEPTRGTQNVPPRPARRARGGPGGVPSRRPGCARPGAPTGLHPGAVPRPGWTRERPAAPLRGPGWRPRSGWRGTARAGNTKTTNVHVYFAILISACFLRTPPVRTPSPLITSRTPPPTNPPPPTDTGPSPKDRLFHTKPDRSYLLVLRRFLRQHVDLVLRNLRGYLAASLPPLESHAFRQFLQPLSG